MSNWLLFLQKRKKQLYYIGLFSFFINLCMLVLPIYSLQVFSRVLTSRSLETLVLLAVIALILLLLQTCLEFIRNRLLATSSAQFEQLCSNQVVGIALNNADNDKKASQQLLHDLKLTRQFLASPATNLFFDLPWTPVFVVAIFSMHSILGWFALTASIVLILLTYVNLYLGQKQQFNIAKNNLENDSYLQRLLESSASIKFYDVSQPLSNKWYKNQLDNSMVELKLSFYTHLLLGMIKYARVALQVGIIAIGAWLVIINEVDAGVMLASSILLTRVLSPLDQGINQWSPWKLGSAAYQRIAKQLAQESYEQRIEMPVESINLSVKNVTHKDSFERIVLSNVHFELKPNNALAIIGASGSGKSTLLKLLAGHDQLQSGEITISGIQLAEILTSQRNKLIGYLPQKVELFNASVLENISCFANGHDINEKVFKVTRLLGIHQFISELPKAYNTMIGEGGVFLSGGQLQLIALARTLFYEPKLLLLDEPDSNLDAQSELQLLKVIERLKNSGVSIVIVSHRTKLLNAVEWVMVMDKGNIINAGKKADVLAKRQKKDVVKKDSD